MIQMMVKVIKMLVSLSVYGVCIEMPAIEKNKCSGQSSCITSYVKFSKVFLDKDILEIAIIARANYRAEEINFKNIYYRKAAYYQFCLENLEREIDVCYNPV